MSKRTSGREAAVGDRFDEFVGRRASQAMLWFVVPQHGRQPDTYVDHVMFETDTYNRHDEELGFIVDHATAHRRRNWAYAVDRLLDHLVQLEDDGHFVPAHKRCFSLAD